MDMLGVVKEYYGTTLPERHVWAAGGTIGDASSGASDLASTEAIDLFTVLWNVANTENSQIKLYDSSGAAATKGTDAATDFAAHYRLSLPDKRGRVALGLNSMGGTSAGVLTNAKANIIGGCDGAEKHTLTVDEMPTHTHSQADGLRTHVGKSEDTKSASCPGFGRPFTTGSAGGSSSHNNMQPWLACNFIMQY